MSEFQTILDTKVNTAVVPAKELKAHTQDRIIIGGIPAVISRDALADCAELAGLSSGKLQNLDTTVGKGSSMAIIQGVFNQLSRSNQDLVIAEQGGEIIRVVKESDRNKAVPNYMFVEAMEKVLAEQQHLSTDSVSVNTHGTKAVVNLITDQVTDLPTAGDESFRLGRSLEWDMFGGISISEYTYRMVCSNGMMGWDRGAQLASLDRNTSPSIWFKELFTELDTEAFALRYMALLQRSQETRLSLREYERMMKLVEGSYALDQDKWGVLGETDWMNSYAGVDLEDVTAKQKANLQTPVNKWEAINVITDLASHQYKSSVGSFTRDKHRKYAGGLLGTAGDMANWAPSWAPVFN